MMKLASLSLACAFVAALILFVSFKHAFVLRVIGDIIVALAESQSALADAHEVSCLWIPTCRLLIAKIRNISEASNKFEEISFKRSHAARKYKGRWGVPSFFCLPCWTKWASHWRALRALSLNSVRMMRQVR